MSTALGYTALRNRLRSAVGNRDTWLHGFRLLRCALIQGPWQPLVIHHYQRHSRNPPLPVESDTLFPELDVAAASRAASADAFAIGLHVPATVVDDIVAWTRRHGAKQINDPHLECDAVRRIVYDPNVVAVARGFLRVEPIVLESKVYWTLPKPDAYGRTHHAAEGGLFHYDLPDVRALTVFIYLTDVTEDCGPHVVIPGTQRRRTPNEILRRAIGDAEAQRRFGDRIRVITGPRGTGWFEDITCYHKQAHAREVRLMLTVLYAMHRRPVTGGRRRYERPAGLVGRAPTLPP